MSDHCAASGSNAKWMVGAAFRMAVPLPVAEKPAYRRRSTDHVIDCNES
jgi:hypothetical protein